MSQALPTAAVLIIGNEILSGRTQDINLNAIAKKLGGVGIALREARVVPDVHEEIIAAVNELRRKYDYLLTTGGIGPTHDDITVDAVAAAFGVGVIVHPEARDILTAHYGVENLTAARLRMARTPDGAGLIPNPVSSAPGIIMGNVYVMAGVPEIMRAMLDNLIGMLRHGPSYYSKTVSLWSPESVIADALAHIAGHFPQLDIGSYPWTKDGKFGTSLVSRGTDKDAVDRAAEEIERMARDRAIEIAAA